MDKEQKIEEDIFDCIEKSNIDAIKYHLNQPIDVNQITDQHETPLWVACEKGHLEIVQLLLEQENININIRDRC